MEIITSARRTKEEIQSLVNAFKKSGKTKKQFCDENNIKYYTLCNWVADYKKKAVSQKLSSFIPVKVNETTPHLFAEISLKSGTSIKLFQNVDAGFIKSILKL